MRHTALILSVLLLAGCATRSYTPTVRYRINPVIKVSATHKNEGSLGIRTLVAARPYKQGIVFDDPGLVVTISDNDEWAEAPATVVTRALSDALVATGRFKDVGEAINLGAPDYILTGELRRFDLSRAHDPWTAECEVRLELRKGIERTPVWAQTLEASKPLAENDVAALPEAMSQAVSKLVNEAANAIAAQQ